MLDPVLATATVASVRTVDGELLHRTADPEALRGLRRALEVGRVLDTVCACLGDYRVEFADGTGARVATLGYHHAYAVRWDGFPADAALRDGPALLHWLAARGVPGPLDRHRADEARRAAARVDAERAEREWRAAAPVPDTVLDAILAGDPPTAGELLAHVRALHDTEPAVALALLAWCRAGTGRYSGHPSYESVPGELLAELPIDVIIEALERPEATDAHLAGAVRHLTGWRSRKRLVRDIGRLPVALRTRLVDVAQHSDDPTVRERARERLA
jgi:hypothetical protein